MATAQDIAPPETKDYYPPPNSALKGREDMPKTFSRSHLTALGNLHCALYPCAVTADALVLDACCALMGLHPLLGGRQSLQNSQPWYLLDHLASFQRVVVPPSTGVFWFSECCRVPLTFMGGARGGGCPNWKACKELPYTLDDSRPNLRKIHVGEKSLSLELQCFTYKY